MRYLPLLLAGFRRKRLRTFFTVASVLLPRKLLPHFHAVYAYCRWADDLADETAGGEESLELLAWFNNTVHPTFTHVFMPHKFSAEKGHHAELQTFNTALFRKQLAEIDALCAKAAPWIGGAEIGPLDLYALTLMRWGGFAGIDPKSWAHLWPHANKVAQHPAVAKAVAREKLDLDVKPIVAA